jgi:hypothetical protein
MDERIEHTGRVPRASRSHTFFQAAGVAEMGGPERPIAPPAQDDPSVGTQPYSDNALHGEGI